MSSTSVGAGPQGQPRQYARILVPRSGLTRAEQRSSRQSRPYAVLPRYSDIHGARPGLGDLVAIVRRYNCFEWLSYLSRINTTLGPSFERDPERQGMILHGLFGPKVRTACNAAAFRAGTRRVLVAPEDCVAALQQLVMLEAPSNGGRTFETDEDRDRLAYALLMTLDLRDDGLADEDPDARIARLAQEFLRRPFAAPGIIVARACAVYELAGDAKSEPAAKLAKWFATATGFSFEDHVLGGVVVAVDEEFRRADEIARGWKQVAPPSPAQDPTVGRLVSAFKGVRATTLERLRHEIRLVERRRDFAEWTTIALSKYPLLEVPDRGTYVLSIARIGESLFEGVRHAIVTAKNNGVSNLPDDGELGKAFGEVVQRYAVQLLSDVCPGRVVPLDPIKRRKRADALLCYPDKIVVLEIKSIHAASHTRRAPLSLTGRVDELHRMQLDKAVNQLASTISDLRDGKLDDRLPFRYDDWTTTMIVPAVISLEKVPLVEGSWRMVEPLTAPLSSLGMSDQIAPLRILHITDFEALLEHAAEREIGQVLLRWARHPTQFERTFLTFAESEALQPQPVRLRQRLAEPMRLVARRLGIPEERLGIRARTP